MFVYKNCLVRLHIPVVILDGSRSEKFLSNRKRRKDDKTNSETQLQSV